MPESGTVVFLAARIPSCFCDWPRKPFGRPGFLFPCCTSTPDIISPKSSSFATRAAELGERLIVRSVGRVHHSKEESILKSPMKSRNVHQSVTLLDTIEELRLDACIGGARRDEEKARAKERIFSFRDEFGQWDPKNQRPELWHLYNTRVRTRGKHPRFSDQQLDGTRRLELHRQGASRSAEHLLRASARGSDAARAAA